MQKVNEIHIEIDVLQSSPEGINQLRDRYYKIIQQIKAQNKIKELMAMQFKKSDVYQRVKHLQAIKSQMTKVDEAQRLIEEHLNKYED